MAENTEIEEKPVVEPEVVVEEPEKRVVSAEDGIEGLKKQLEAEKSRREAAERQAKEAAAAVHKAKTEVDETNLQLVTNAIETAKSRAASLKAALADAMAKSDYLRAADIQIELAANTHDLRQMELGRQAMAERPKTTPPPVIDDAEAKALEIERRGYTRSAAWMRAHPQYGSGKMYDKLVAAHNMTVVNDIPPDTDEYFAAVERHLGIAKPVERAEPEEDGTELAAKPVSRRSSPPAAPVSRSGSSTPSNNPRVIRLSAEEREMARMSQMTDQEYWEQKQKISRDSRYN